MTLYRNHAEEIEAVRREFTPDRYRRAEGQIGPLWEPVNRRRLPSGWWVAPFIVFGTAGWAVALWAVLS